MPRPALDALIISSYVNFMGTLKARYYFSFMKKLSKRASWGSEVFSKTCTTAQLKQRRVRLGMQHYLILMLLFFQIITVPKKNGKFAIYWTSPCLELFWTLHISISRNPHQCVMVLQLLQTRLAVKQMEDRKIKSLDLGDIMEEYSSNLGGLGRYNGRSEVFWIPIELDQLMQKEGF